VLVRSAGILGIELGAEIARRSQGTPRPHVAGSVTGSMPMLADAPRPVLAVGGISMVRRR
jgi:hypothetical protein